VKAGVPVSDDARESLVEDREERVRLQAAHGQPNRRLCRAVILQQGHGRVGGTVMLEQHTARPHDPGGIAVLAGDEPGWDAGLTGRQFVDQAQLGHARVAELGWPCIRELGGGAGAQALDDQGNVIVVGRVDAVGQVETLHHGGQLFGKTRIEVGPELIAVVATE